MSLALYLLTILAFLGAFDTLYYHELRSRLAGRAPNQLGGLVCLSSS